MYGDNCYGSSRNARGRMDHLKHIGYWRHMGCALKWAYLLCVAGVLGFIHAVFPFMFKDSMTTIVSKVKASMGAEKRKKRTRSRKSGR